MSFLDRLFKRTNPQQQKSLPANLFSFFTPSAMPQMNAQQFLAAYTDWVYACTSAIAKRMADIELKLQERKDGEWIDIDEHPALDTLHKVNKFMSFYDLWEGTQSYIELTGDAFWLLRWNKGKTELFDMWLLDPTR